MAYDLNRLSADAAHGQYGHAGIDRYLLTSQIKSVDSDFDVDMADATTLGNEAQNNLPGIPKGMIKMELVHSPALDFQLQPLKRQSQVLGWIAKRGLSAGSHIEMFPGSFGKDGSKFDEKSVATKSVEFGTRGAFHTGRIVLSPKGALLSGASGLGPVDANTAYQTGDTTFGGAAYLFVWDIQGGGTFTPKVQHCTTSGGTYTDIPGATFAAASGTLGAPVNWVQQLYIPSSTAVHEFVQVSWSTTGSPTGIQALLGFARSFDRSL